MNENAIRTGILVIGLGAGGGAGYFLAKRKYRLLAEEEIESVKAAFKELRTISDRAEDKKKTPPARPEGSLISVPDQQPRTEAQAREFTAYNQVVADAGYVGPKGDPGSSEVDQPDYTQKPVESVEVTVDENREVDVKVSYSNGLPNDAALVTAAVYEERIDGVPYLIDVGEFIQNEAEFDVHTMTWYAGDNTLIFDDEPDKMVDDLDIVGGYRNLKTFGEDLLNQHTIYVRDDRNEKMFEIVRDTRRFSAGMDV